MFDLDPFVADCRMALDDRNSHLRVRELVARATREPEAVLRGLGEPKEGGVQRVSHAPDLTILSVVWPPYMTVVPHNHAMWAVIGVYSGREDNIFWRRLPDHPAGKVEAAGAKSIAYGEALPLGRDIIHSVTNPVSRLTAALHVYGGDFFTAERNEWDAENLTMQPLDIERTLKRFADANAHALPKA